MALLDTDSQEMYGRGSGRGLQKWPKLSWTWAIMLGPRLKLVRILLCEPPRCPNNPSLVGTSYLSEQATWKVKFSPCCIQGENQSFVLAPHWQWKTFCLSVFHDVASQTSSTPRELMTAYPWENFLSLPLGDLTQEQVKYLYYGCQYSKMTATSSLLQVLINHVALYLGCFGLIQMRHAKDFCLSFASG